MKHRIAGRRLDRTTEHRTAMFKNMVSSLLRHERIQTRRIVAMSFCEPRS